jgi:hypothetical protein
MILIEIDRQPIHGMAKKSLSYAMFCNMYDLLQAITGSMELLTAWILEANPVMVFKVLI